MNIVFELIQDKDQALVEKEIVNKNRIWLIEPFFAAHHLSREGFLPPKQPGFLDFFLDHKVVEKILASDLCPDDLFFQSRQRAVETTESVYQAYKSKKRELIEFVAAGFGEDETDRIFKSWLSKRLVGFFSMNLNISRFLEQLPLGKVLFYPDVDIEEYFFIKSLLSSQGIEHENHPDVFFPERLIKDCKKQNQRAKKVLLRGLAARSLSGGLKSLTRKKKHCEPQKRPYLYYDHAGFENGEDLLGDLALFVDNHAISSADVTVITETDLKPHYRKKLDQKGFQVLTPPLDNPPAKSVWGWKKLSSLLSRNETKLEEARFLEGMLSQYAIWKVFFTDNQVSHWIQRHESNGIRFGREIAMKEAGTQQWLLTCPLRHKFMFQDSQRAFNDPHFAYLGSTRVVTCNNTMKRYLEGHPFSAEQCFAVGCLQAGGLKGETSNLGGNLIERLGQKFVLGVFDASYHINAFAKYSDGIALAKQIMELLTEFEELEVYFKEEEPRSLHAEYDPAFGPKLIEAYDRLGRHGRITFFSCGKDSSKVLSACDAVISSPFSCNTILGRKLNKPSIWHDPLGNFKGSLAAAQPGMTTQGYRELRAWVKDRILRVPMQSDLEDTIFQEIDQNHTSTPSLTSLLIK